MPEYDVRFTAVQLLEVYVHDAKVYKGAPLFWQVRKCVIFSVGKRAGIQMMKYHL